ncbi:MAG: carbohydrate binding family 9 domain-containing protein [Gemmatimonadaceae bacterium]
MHRLTSFVVAGCLGLISASGLAQPSSKRAVAQRVTSAAPKVDGRLDDVIWQQAAVIEDFVQKRPIEGIEPTERTRVQIAYDDAALYVGARMFRKDPSRLVRAVTRRDGFGNSEFLSITLDTQRDRRTAFGFVVSSAGVKSDYHHARDDEMGGREYQYDPVWDAAVQVDSLGWTAEMRIPFSQVRFSLAPVQEWGMQLDRWVPDQNEDIMWVMVPNRETGFVSRFGTLTGITGIRPTRPVEMLPYVAGDARRTANADPLNPFRNPSNIRLGVDAKFGIGSNLTLDATVNPDLARSRPSRRGEPDGVRDHL